MIEHDKLLEHAIVYGATQRASPAPRYRRHWPVVRTWCCASSARANHPPHRAGGGGSSSSAPPPTRELYNRLRAPPHRIGRSTGCASPRPRGGNTSICPEIRITLSSNREWGILGTEKAGLGPKIPWGLYSIPRVEQLGPAVSRPKAGGIPTGRVKNPKGTRVCPPFSPPKGGFPPRI